jgi:hypothetical protein
MSSLKGQDYGSQKTSPAFASNPWKISLSAKEIYPAMSSVDIGLFRKLKKGAIFSKKP